MAKLVNTAYCLRFQIHPPLKPLFGSDNVPVHNSGHNSGHKSGQRLAGSHSLNCVAQPKKNVFDYPLIVKRHLQYLTFSIPDLGVSLVVPVNTGQKLDAKFLNTIAKNMGQAWIKGAMRLQNLERAQMPAPQASATKTTLSSSRPKTLTAPQVAKILQVSENTVRRMTEDGTLACEHTRGGHRRYSPIVIEEFLRRGL